VLKFNIILEKIRASNDEAAFREIYDEYAKKIKAVAFHVLGRWDFGDDILQEVLIRIWNHDKYVKNPSGWIYKLAANAAHDFYRKNLKDEKNFVPLESVAENADAIKTESDTYSEIMFESMLGELGKIDREIVIRKVYFSYTYEEIAVEMKISRTVVYERFQKALETLRATYQKNKF